MTHMNRHGEKIIAKCEIDYGSMDTYYFIQQQKPSLIPLGKVGYMDQTTS